MALRAALIQFRGLVTYARPLNIKQQTNPVINSSIFIRLAKFHLMTRPNKPLLTKQNLMLFIKKKFSLKGIIPQQPNWNSPCMFSVEVIGKFYEVSEFSLFLFIRILQCEYY
ncbi:uncharacterized protein LOC119675840 [Teleopsis dalmanni]|uniref:uncharacterized protein LOC119675840 n=1 Tax=Teleopsis dalmanni TaxID=139649 RepID=UPI0018CFA7F6|nr:uncharacterized protein LOC119675840 [Teleopsis dalmanni]